MTITIEQFFHFGSGCLVAIGFVLMVMGFSDKKRKFLLPPGGGIMVVGIILLAIFH